MSSKTARLVAVTAGVLLALTVTTGSTQAQQSSGSGSGSILDGAAVTSWVKPAPERVVRTPLRRQMCEEFMRDYSKPSKG